MRWMGAAGVVAVGVMSAVVHAQYLSGAQVGPPPAPPGINLGFPVFGMSTPGAGGGAKEEPYWLTETITTVRPFADGTTITRLDYVTRMRDSQGRTRTELANRVNGEEHVYRIDIADPVKRVTLYLRPRTKDGWVTHTGEQKPPKAYGVDDYKAVPGIERRQFEALPERTIAGIKATGQRSVYVMAIDYMGNDREMRTVSEIWTSPELNIELERTVDDPTTGRSTAVVTRLERKEPDPAMFCAPEDYKIIDTKKP